MASVAQEFSSVGGAGSCPAGWHLFPLTPWGLRPEQIMVGLANFENSHLQLATSGPDTRNFEMNVAALGLD